MRLHDAVVSAIFQRKVQLAYEIETFGGYQKFEDGVSLIEFKVSLDYYLGDHNPEFELSLRVLNCTIFEVTVYNTLHIEHMQRVDKYSDELNPEDGISKSEVKT